MSESASRRQLPIASRLFWKIFVSLWLAIGGIALGVDFVVDALFQAELKESPNLSIGYRAELATTLVAVTLQHTGLDATREMVQQWAGKRHLPVMVVEEETGQDFLQRPVPSLAFLQALKVLESKPEELAVRRVTALNGNNFVLFVPLSLLPATPPTQHVYRYPDSSGVEFLSMTLASLLFAAGLAWYLHRPIRHLHEANQRFAAGDLGTRVSPLVGARNDEIADLARDFDHMAERLETTVNDKTRLLHVVSHELRSPLTRMQVALELARKAPEKTERMLDRIGYEIARLDTILGETLALSRLESQTEAPVDDCINLVELLEDIVNDTRFEAEQSGRTIDLDASGEILITGRGELLRSAIENVIRNGMRHTPEGSKTSIKVTESGNNWVAIRICDDGPGVPDDELEAIFEPFFRGRRTRSDSGHGLGLSIVRRAIEVHGGKVHADNDPTGGLCVVLQLPVATLENAPLQ
jgi:two-component system OmpR family sensor kinase